MRPWKFKKRSTGSLKRLQVLRRRFARELAARRGPLKFSSRVGVWFQEAVLRGLSGTQPVEGPSVGAGQAQSLDFAGRKPAGLGIHPDLSRLHPRPPARAKE